MMILVVAPVLQASLYLMLHESMQRRRDDCYPYKSVYITT
ncbi:hypothetical protein ACB094_11G036100 [Castanea mollissima]